MVQNQSNIIISWIGIMLLLTFAFITNPINFHTNIDINALITIAYGGLISLSVIYLLKKLI